MEEDVLVGEESQDRMPRDLESRNNTARLEQWSPPPILPDPTPQPDGCFGISDLYDGAKRCD